MVPGRVAPCEERALRRRSSKAPRHCPSTHSGDLWGGASVCGQAAELVHSTQQRGTPAVTAHFLIQSQPRISTKLASPTEP